MECFIRLTVPADCQPAGAMAIPHARLVKALKATKAKTATIEPLPDLWARLRLGALSLKIQGWNLGSIPPLPSVERPFGASTMPHATSCPQTPIPALAAGHYSRSSDSILTPRKG